MYFDRFAMGENSTDSRTSTKDDLLRPQSSYFFEQNARPTLKNKRFSSPLECHVMENNCDLSTSLR